MLKEVLVEWKKQVEGKGLAREEQIQKMKDLVGENDALLENPFFKSIKAL